MHHASPNTTLSPSHPHIDSHTDTTLTHASALAHPLSQYPITPAFYVRARASSTTQAQDVSYEQPMTPITMMRNALGKSEGGSGVPLDRAQYDASVKFWREHVQVS